MCVVRETNTNSEDSMAVICGRRVEEILFSRMRKRIQERNAPLKLVGVSEMAQMPKIRCCDDEMCNKPLKRYRIRWHPYEFCSARCFHHWYKIDKTFRDLVDKYKNGSNSEPCQ